MSAKKNSWLQCDKCQANLLNKDLDKHEGNCPPSADNFLHPYIYNSELFAGLDIKTNDEIKGLDYHDKNNLLFMSQSVIQLCGFVIGDWCVVTTKNNAPCARIVWPTIEKSLNSALVTQSGYDLYWRNRSDVKICVSSLTNTSEAQQITLIALNAPKTLQLTSELNLRIKKLHMNRFVTEGNKLSCIFYGKQLEFTVKHILPSVEENPTFYKISNSTVFKLFGTEIDLKPVKQINPLSEIAGYETEINEIHDYVDVALGRVPTIPHMKIPRGLLVYGASGTGKTLIVNGIAQTSRCATVININGADLYAKYPGVIEETITQHFNEALNHPPSIIILDELDVLCPLRSNKTTEQEKRVTATLLTQFDRLCLSEGVFVLATSNKPEQIDPAFRKHNRIEREIEITIPTPETRFKILKKILSVSTTNGEEKEIRAISDQCHGYTGSDMHSLVSRAALCAIKRMTDCILIDDLKYASSKTIPSAMRAIQVEIPDVKWSDIGGQHRLKLILKQAVEWPLKYAESFRRLGVTAPRGVLMYGPPGCSKTMIAKALATESKLNFLSIKGPELFSKYVGESERAIREVFRRARQVAPSVVFFDELDALGGERTSGASSGGTSVQERVLAQLLTELDGITPLKDVTIVAATNRPDRIDRALIRPGRLDRIVYVPLPDPDTRTEIFALKLARMPTDGVDVNELVLRTGNYSGAEINAVCHEAAMCSLEEDLQAKIVNWSHFEKALTIVKPRTSQHLLDIYENYVQQTL